MEVRRFLFRGLTNCFGALLLFCSVSQALAADVPLSWDPSISPNVKGYKLYMGNASRTYNTSVTLGNQTAYTVTGLGTGNWYFAVTAFDINGNESDFSNEVTQTINDSQQTSNPSQHTCNFNGDTSVDALDLQSMANVILGLSTASAAYDLNSDGRVDVLDLQILNNVILGLRSCP